jgi:hypothetical protein
MQSAECGISGRRRTADGGRRRRRHGCRRDAGATGNEVKEVAAGAEVRAAGEVKPFDRAVGPPGSGRAFDGELAAGVAAEEECAAGGEFAAREGNAAEDDFSGTVEIERGVDEDAACAVGSDVQRDISSCR